MKIDMTKTRTLTSPTYGVTFNKEDSAAIEEAATVLATLDEQLIFAIRRSLAREILHLNELGDWTSGEAEDIRFSQQKHAMISYEATWAAAAGARLLAAKKEKQS